MTFVCADINDFLSSPEGKSTFFDHIEAYGVLHHIQSFAETIKRLSERLHPHGTLRIMVYNAHARDWIWDINRALRCLSLSYAKDSEINAARSLLKNLAKFSPRLQERLGQMGQIKLQNNTWFADTFMHPWESRATIDAWISCFDTANLQPMALFDRYAELDDLENPLWKMPNTKDLLARCIDRRFENNLEIWLRPKNSVGLSGTAITSKSSASTPWLLKLKTAPTNWGLYPETKSLSLMERYTLWLGWISAINGTLHPQSDALIKKLPLAAARRLARIGAITRSQARRCGRELELMERIHLSMEAPDLPPLCQKAELIAQEISKAAPAADSKHQQQALNRFIRSI
jgi:hypothetical protein